MGWGWSADDGRYSAFVLNNNPTQPEEHRHTPQTSSRAGQAQGLVTSTCDPCQHFSYQHHPANLQSHAAVTTWQPLLRACQYGYCSTHCVPVRSFGGRLRLTACWAGLPIQPPFGANLGLRHTPIPPGPTATVDSANPSAHRVQSTSVICGPFQMQPRGLGLNSIWPVWYLGSCRRGGGRQEY